ncbi:MAG TPA: nuclear transport factor 2 family protein [Solirubrobacterales bacterium]
MDRSIRTRQSAFERLFLAVQRGEPEEVLKLLHSKVEWTPTLWSGESMYRGHEGVHLWLSQFGENLEYLDVRVTKIEGRGDRGAAHGIVFDTRGNQKFAVEVAWSYELEEGLLRRGRAHDSWEEALRAAGLAEGSDRPASPATEEPDPRARPGALVRFRQALRPNPECPVGRHFCRFSRR